MAVNCFYFGVGCPTEMNSILISFEFNTNVNIIFYKYSLIVHFAISLLFQIYH